MNCPYQWSHKDFSDLVVDRLRDSATTGTRRPCKPSCRGVTIRRGAEAPARKRG